eukprot:SAG31_NODE_6930_length_1846_cov_1.756153_1_plen_52_part_00
MNIKVTTILLVITPHYQKEMLAAHDVIVHIKLAKILINGHTTKVQPKVPIV